MLPGTFPIHDLDDVGVDLQLAGPVEYTTVAGLALSLLGRVPDTAGDTVSIEGWRLEVVAVARHAVTGVRLSPLEQAADER